MKMWCVGRTVYLRVPMFGSMLPSQGQGNMNTHLPVETHYLLQRRFITEVIVIFSAKRQILSVPLTVNGLR